MNSIANKSGAGESIIISNMSLCLPADSLFKTPKKYHWQLIPYEAKGISGVMIGATSLKEAPDVTLPLNVSGWYAINIGFWNPLHAYDGSFKIRLKLTGDPSFRVIADDIPQLKWPGEFELKEVFYAYADLSGKALVIGQQNKGTPRKAYLAYVKLVPLSQQAVENIKKDRTNKGTRILYALNDGNGLFYNGPTTREDILTEIGLYRYSDVKAVLFAAASGEIVNYPSKIGIPWSAGSDDEVASEELMKARNSLRTLLQNNIVPIQVFTDYLHQIDVELHATFRLSIIRDIPPSTLWRQEDGLVGRRPDLRMVDKDGVPIEKASYAYPEVRAYMLSIIREVAENYNIDGIDLCFIRGPHFIGYEDVVIRDFKEKYDIDPRNIDENDNRAQQHRASYLTEFVRSARKLVDDIGKTKNRKISLSAEGYVGKVEYNLFYGLDVMTWLKEGLLDSLFMSAPFEPEILKAARDHKCKIIAHTIPCSASATGDMPECIRTVKEGFGIGVDGFWCWDMNGRQENPLYWEVLRQIGHKEAITKFAKKLPEYKIIKLKTIDGLDVSHITNRGADARNYWPPEMIPIYSGG